MTRTRKGGMTQKMCRHCGELVAWPKNDGQKAHCIPSCLPKRKSARVTDKDIKARFDRWLSRQPYKMGDDDTYRDYLDCWKAAYRCAIRASKGKP